MNASNVAHERTRPVALRTNKARVLVAAPVALPPTPDVAIGAPLPFVPAAVEVNQGAQEGALLIRAPRVDAQRPSDPAFAPPFVNVAEEGQRRLVPLDGRAHRRAAALFQHA